MSCGSKNSETRAADWNPKNRFEQLDYEIEPQEDDDERPPRKTQFFRDSTRSVITYNKSPDVGFAAGINPYRGCEHGCIYCYARPSHEYLGFSAGLDFESRIMIKEDAPQLLREELSARKWTPQVIALSGNTDCYQPIERKLQITRRCLAVLAESRNPVALITKNELITRDIDLLRELARFDAVSVAISLTTLDAELRRRMEPRTSPPARRLAAIRALADAGIPVGVLLAPMIPGLTDHEIPALLHAAAAAGAKSAAFLPVRLPLAVAPLFERWIEQNFPGRKEKILGRIRSLRGGRLNDPRFGSRMRGEGIYAGQMRSLFETGCRKAGIAESRTPLSTAAFRVPSSQLVLF